MTATTQKRLAIGAALAAVALVLAANAQLLTAAIGSQPDCVAVEDVAVAAKPAC